MYNFINNKYNVFNLVSLCKSCVTFALNQNYTNSFGCEGHYFYFLKLKVTGKNVFKKAMVSLGGHFMPSIFCWFPSSKIF